MKKFSLLLLILTLVGNAQGADSPSNITLRNTASTTKNVTGIYIQRLTTGNSCDALVGNMATPAHGLANGVFWKKMKFSPDSTQSLGANFLYQIMTQLLFQVYQNSGSNCIPGTGKCAFGTDAPNTGSWCIRLGIIQGSPMLPTDAIAGANDLLPIGDAETIKIRCNDSSLTCTADSSVIQNF